MSKIIYDIYRNVKSGSISEGRYFGRVLQTETLNTAKLARHIAEHGSPYTQDVVEGVLRKAESCILELILDSKKIKIDGLGTFYITGENQKHGTISIAKFNPKTSFKGLHIRFLLNQASFIWAEDLKREKAEERPEGSTNENQNQGGSGSSGSGNSGNSGNSGSQTPTATLNGSSVTLTESDGTYTGTFQMPDGYATLVINSGSSGGGGVDQN